MTASDASEPAAFDLDTYGSSNLHKYESESRLYRWHLDAFHEALSDLIAEADPASMLDAGCGEGVVTEIIRRRHPHLDLTGVDLSSPAIAYARQEYGSRIRFEVGSVYDLSYEDSAFDTVLCSEVLEHLERPEEALRELRRVAREHVVLTVPLEPYFEVINRIGRWLGLSPDPGHVQFWTHRDFRRLVRDHLEDPTFRIKHVYQLALGRTRIRDAHP